MRLFTRSAQYLRSVLDEISLRLFPQARKRRYFANVLHATDADFLAGRVDPELRLLPLLLSPGKAFLDIGAHIGEYCFVAERYIDPTHIYAFEPQSYYARRIRKLFPRAHVTQVALSDHAGTATLKIPIMRGRVYATRATLERFSERGETNARYETVPLTTLDQFRREHPVGKIGCMKIDVEGHERSVIAGARETLRQDRPNLIIEIEQRHHQEPMQEVLDDILSAGYRGYFFDPSGKRFRTLPEFQVERFQAMNDFKTGAYVNNFIFLPEESSMEVAFPQSPFLP